MHVQWLATNYIQILYYSLGIRRWGSGNNTHAIWLIYILIIEADNCNIPASIAPHTLTFSSFSLVLLESEIFHSQDFH